MPNTSIREQIVEAIKDRLEGMTEPTYDISFKTVKRQKFTSIDKGKEISAAIFDDSDRRRPDIDPVVRVELNVIIEFMTYVRSSVKPTTKLNLILSEVERALMTDRTLGGLAIDIRVDRTEHDVEGRFDKYPETIMYLIIDFRHNNLNPSLPV